MPAAPLTKEPVTRIRNVARRPLDGFRRHFRELGKFGTVGGLSYGLDSWILLLCQLEDINPLLGKTISTTIAATAAFVGNRFWTWRHRERSGLHREYLLYFLFNAVGLAIGLACIGVTHYVLGARWPACASKAADFVSANVVGMGLGTLFRFWSYRRFVFRAPGTAEPEPTAPGPPTPEVAQRP